MGDGVDVLRKIGWADFAALLVAGVAAALAPLQVFMLAFAFLGPFHYLTEIAWLRKKKFYFSEGMVSPTLYLVLASVMAVGAVVEHIVRRDFGFWIVSTLLLLALTVWVRNVYALVAIAVASLLVGKVLRTWIFFMAIMVPTLVHVYFFTGVFMVTGAMRNKDRAWVKWVNPVLLVAIPVVLLFVRVHYAAPGKFWLENEQASFAALHSKLAGDLHHTMVVNASLLNDPVVAAVMRIFAFTYFFHYLNWFAKTELLAWHKVSRRGWVGIAVVYAASVGVYLWNFRVGFVVASFLSILHVLLEFPLNWHSMRFLALRLQGKDAGVKPRAAVVAV